MSIHRGNEVLRLGISTALLDRGDDVAPSVTAIFEDITDLERVDELNLRAERLEAVATLSASLAHEIKNPLASIRSAIEQLGGEKLNTEDRALLQRLVLTESDRLSRLLSEFLDYSGVRLGARQRVELRGLVTDCVAVARQHPDLDGIDLRLQMDEGTMHVLGDSDLLHRALLNLVLNAGQHAGPEGTVVVSLEDERYRRTPRGVNVRSPVAALGSRLGSGDPSRDRKPYLRPVLLDAEGWKRARTGASCIVRWRPTPGRSSWSGRSKAERSSSSSFRDFRKIRRGSVRERCT